MNKELSSFAARLREIIQGRDAALRRPDSAAHCPCQEPEFNSLALGLFALQFKYNAAYRKICEARGLTPDVVEHWTQIPAAPAAVFKELVLTCLAPRERSAVFYSSGTTEQKPSRHFHSTESLKLYEDSMWLWFVPHMVPEFGIRNSKFEISILTPPPEQAPHSSLVHMFETIRQKLGGAPVLRSSSATEDGSVPASRSPFVGKAENDGMWTLELDAVLSALQNQQSAIRNPQLILGTAFSFVYLIDFLSGHDLRFRLPDGSRVMETGGYKNRSRAMPKAELHALITERLGVPPGNIICEYGMSELSSQAYAVTSDKWQVTRNGEASCHLSPVTCHFTFPPWVRVQIISPETGREVADGETGLIRVYDLANVFSVMAVQTEDLALRRGDGFELLGRAEFAEQRGCSLMSAGISPQRHKGAEKKLDNSKLCVSASLR